MSDDAKVRITWTSDRDATPEQYEAFKAFVLAHPETRSGGCFKVEGVVWTSTAMEYEYPADQ